MSSKTIENKLARIIYFTASCEADLENDRIALANHPCFEPFQIFRKMDSSSKGYLNEKDLAIFLSLHQFHIEEKNLRNLLTKKPEGQFNITFQDFIQHLSPQSDEILKNRCLSRIGEVKGQRLNFDEVEQLVARIYRKENEFRNELQNNKESLANLGRAGLDETLTLLTDESIGYLTLQSVARFMQKNNYDFSMFEFEAFTRRVDTSKKGRVDLQDFKFFLSLPKDYISSSIGEDRKSAIGPLFPNSSPIKDISVTGNKIKINDNYRSSHITSEPYYSSRRAYYAIPETKVNITTNYKPIPYENNSFKTQETLNFLPSQPKNYQNEFRKLQTENPRESHYRYSTSPVGRTRESIVPLQQSVIPGNYNTQSSKILPNDKIEQIRRSYGLSPGSSSRIIEQKAYTPLAVSSYLDEKYRYPLNTSSLLPKPTEQVNSHIHAKYPAQHSDFSSLPRNFDIQERKHLNSISPIKSQYSLQKNEFRSQPYIVPNLPPKYEYPQFREGGLSRSPILSRHLPENDRVPTSFYKPTTSINPSPQNNYKVVINPVEQNPPFFSENSRENLRSEVISNKVDINPVNNYSNPSGLLQTNGLLSNSTQGILDSTLGKPSEKLFEGIRKSTVLETYQNEKLRSPFEKEKSHFNDIGIENERKQEYRFLNIESSVKTEGDQPSASLYRFANSKYEQLWTTGSE